MTEAERQTVIDALELFQQYLQAYDWNDPDDYCNAVEALAIMRREREPVAWVIPGDDNADARGFLDAMAWQEGEFSRPLYGD